MESLGEVAVVATAEGADSTMATLATRHRYLGHLEFKTVLMDVLHAFQRNQFLPRREGCRQTSKYLERVHIDIVGPMPVKSAGGGEYKYVTMDDYARMVYTKPLRLKSRAADAFNMFKVATENESGNQLCEVMTNNAQ